MSCLTELIKLATPEEYYLSCCGPTTTEDQKDKLLREYDLERENKEESTVIRNILREVSRGLFGAIEHFASDDETAISILTTASTICNRTDDSVTLMWCSRVFTYLSSNSSVLTKLLSPTVVDVLLTVGNIDLQFYSDILSKLFFGSHGSELGFALVKYFADIRRQMKHSTVCYY
jgi:hypothetical protein